MLHEYKRAVVSIREAILSASPPMMADSRKPAEPPKGMGVQIEVRRILSAVKRFADSFSRTWDLRDVGATATIVEVIVAKYGLDDVVF